MTKDKPAVKKDVIKSVRLLNSIKSPGGSANTYSLESTHHTFSVKGGMLRVTGKSYTILVPLSNVGFMILE